MEALEDATDSHTLVCKLAHQLNAQSFSSTSAREVVGCHLLHNEAVMEIIVQVPCSDLREGNGYRIKHDRHF